MIECREMIDTLKKNENDKFATSKCNDCEDLQKEFSKNPGGKPMNNKGLVLVAVTGRKYSMWLLNITLNR